VKGRRFITRLAATLLIAASTAEAARPSAETLRVFAAASLAGAFSELSRDFERSHPGARVQLNLAGSQQLVAQLEQGAPADVFASADTRWMQALADRSLLEAESTPFARNRLVVIVPRTNPARIATLADLARPGVKLVLGAEAVPVGAYSREMLRNLSRDPVLGPTFGRRTLANLVSEEENVKAVVGKVQLGEADAGVVYRSDVTAANARYVRMLEIPDSANVIASYPIAVLAGARRPEWAREFVSRVLSEDGQRTLARHGLIPIASTRP
jgi:molybdate transport system substrate-binding protein